MKEHPLYNPLRHGYSGVAQRSWTRRLCRPRLMP
jgi:hypothetical protein